MSNRNDPRVIAGRDWARQVCKALSLDPLKVRRIVIDAQVGEVLSVYIEAWGDDRLIDIQLPDAASLNLVTNLPQETDE